MGRYNKYNRSQSMRQMVLGAILLVAIIVLAFFGREVQPERVQVVKTIDSSRFIK